MAVDFREDGWVEIHPLLPQETYNLLVRYAMETGLTLDQAMQQILTVALDVDKGTLARLAEADRLREEAEAKVADYENRTSWFTNCGYCAQTLDFSYKQTVRAETAEASLEKLHKRMAGGDERTHEIGMRLLAATEGPWWSDQTDTIYRLHGIMGRVGEQLGGLIPEQIMNKQILKAEKKDQRYQEYWPDAGDAAFIENAWSDISFLLTELQHAKNKVSFLLKMPRRIASGIYGKCPELGKEHFGGHCDFEVASKVALEIGKEMRDELTAMDEIGPVEPS